MRSLWNSLISFFTSLQLTVVLLILSLILVFVGTLDQVNLGIWAVQEKYFRSWFVWWPVSQSGVALPIYPGGYLIGSFLLTNLLAAHVYHFKFVGKKVGILLTHLGLIILLIGELLSGLLQEDYHMRLDEGQTSNFSESSLVNELAIINASDAQWDEVTAIPEKALEKGSAIQHPSLPFRIVPRSFHRNAHLQMRSQLSNPPPAVATQGIGAQVAVTPQPPTYKPNERNLPAAAVELIGPDGTLGTWVVSLMLDQQTFTHEGKTWRMVLRPARYYKPYSLTLLNFTHDRYAGTEIPKNFSSRVRLRTEDGKTDREVLIYMNNPLRFEGLTFYQAGFENNDRTTILQVVKNPGWLLPYVACLTMSLGLIIQFGISLGGFIRKRTARAAVTAA